MMILSKFVDRCPDDRLAIKADVVRLIACYTDQAQVDAQLEPPKLAAKLSQTYCSRDIYSVPSSEHLTSTSCIYARHTNAAHISSNFHRHRKATNPD